MDYKFIFVILLVGHLLGDFYFQSQSMVNRKDREMKVMITHGFIYLAVYLVVVVLPFSVLFAVSKERLGLILWVPLLHIAVDIVKGLWLSRQSIFEKRQGILFAADQAIHLSVIAIVAYIYAIDITVAYSKVGEDLGKIYMSLNLDISANKLIRLLCLFLFLGKPVNIIVREIISIVEMTEKTGSERNQKAGRVIGVLERYLTVILILLGQYTAVGFAFTAKSVIRFDKISNDKDFAEQYLIGTMSSMLFALIGAVLYL